MKLVASVMVIAGTETHRPGETFETDDAEGRRLVERKLATPVTEDPARKGRRTKAAEVDEDA